MRTIKPAQFTDSNGRDAGVRRIRLHLSGSGAPFAVVFEGTSWRATGKSGPSLGNRPTAAPAGTMMYELRTPDDARLWVDAAGTFVHLD